MLRTHNPDLAQGSAAEMLESVSTDSRHYPQVRGARFAEGGERFTAMPRMTLRLRYRTWKLRALCRIDLAPCARGGAMPARPRSGPRASLPCRVCCSDNAPALLGGHTMIKIEML